eukprot:1657949-Prorocentrum_lima.AAC.1
MTPFGEVLGATSRRPACCRSGLLRASGPTSDPASRSSHRCRWVDVGGIGLAECVHDLPLLL